MSHTLATSNGVVTAAANPPATPPATICVMGLYVPSGFNTPFKLSYAENCTAVNGTVMVKVVG
jgi:hypothetical protein